MPELHVVQQHVVVVDEVVQPRLAQQTVALVLAEVLEVAVFVQRFPAKIKNRVFIFVFVCLFLRFSITQIALLFIRFPVSTFSIWISSSRNSDLTYVS